MRGLVIAIHYVVIAVGLVAVSSASILFQFSSAAPLTVAFYRLAISVLLLSGPLLLSRAQRPDPRDIRLSTLSGAFLALHFAAWFSSLRLTSITASTVLVSMHPLVVLAYGSVAKGERTTAPGLLGAAVAVAGAALVGWGDGATRNTALLGDSLAFLGAVAVSGYLIIGRDVRQRMGAVQYSVIAYMAATLLLLGVSLLQGNALGGFSTHEWLVFGALALLPTLFGHTLFNWALRYVNSSVISISILAEPIGATALAWLIWGTLPSHTTLAGGALILMGIGLFLRYGQGH